MEKLFKTDDSWVLMVQRVVLAAVMLPHGAQKLLGWFGGPGFSGTIEMFGAMGTPTFMTVLVILAESFGALALAFGLFSRVGAFGITAVMLGATLMVHLPHGFFMNWHGAQGGEGFEYHLLALVLSVPLVIKGGGRYAADSAIAQWFAQARSGRTVAAHA